MPGSVTTGPLKEEETSDCITEFKKKKRDELFTQAAPDPSWGDPETQEFQPSAWEQESFSINLEGGLS